MREENTNSRLYSCCMKCSNAIFSFIYVRIKNFASRLRVPWRRISNQQMQLPRFPISVRNIQICPHSFLIFLREAGSPFISYIHTRVCQWNGIFKSSQENVNNSRDGGVKPNGRSCSSQLLGIFFSFLSPSLLVPI